MSSEKLKIKKLFAKLCGQPKNWFPAKGQILDAPMEQGVYIISKGRTVFLVGRTTRAKKGLHQRLSAHLFGRLSFTKAFLIEMGVN